VNLPRIERIKNAYAPRVITNEPGRQEGCPESEYGADKKL
jgi:hypothetical protein